MLMGDPAARPRPPTTRRSMPVAPTRVRSPTPEVIGHRGAPREFRENTLPSLLRALELGADAIELDVHATREGVVVVHHDAALDTTAALPAALRGAAIADVDWTALSAVDLGGGARVPRLADVLDAVGDRGTVYIEIKGTGIERAVVECLRAAPRTPVAVHAFDHRVTRAVHALAPSVPVGVLLASYLLDPVAVMRATGARDWWQRWEQIDERLVALVHGAGGRVVAWTANDLAACGRMAAMGVDALCGDLPEQLRATFPR